MSYRSPTFNFFQGLTIEELDEAYKECAQRYDLAIEDFAEVIFFSTTCFHHQVRLLQNREGLESGLGRRTVGPFVFSLLFPDVCSGFTLFQHSTLPTVMRAETYTSRRDCGGYKIAFLS